MHRFAQIAQIAPRSLRHPQNLPATPCPKNLYPGQEIGGRPKNKMYSISIRMSGIDELRNLLREVTSELMEVEQKLSRKESGIQEKLNLENMKLMKGKEHTLTVYKEQMASSERK